MKLADLTALLNQDLTREYAHWHFYTNAAARVQGLHREEFREFFLKKAASEALHIDQWAKLIIGRGGTPLTTPNHYVVSLTSPREILQEALRMEQEVVMHFVTRMEDCIQLYAMGENDEDKVHARYVEIFLEDQILDSQGDVDELKELIKGL